MASDDNDKSTSKGNDCLGSKRTIALLVVGVIVGCAACGLAIGFGVRRARETDGEPSPSTPTAPMAPAPSPQTPSAPTTVRPSILATTAPVTASEAEYLKVFADAVGDDVYVPGTTAYIAAQWMLYEDPAETTILRISGSFEDALQRYLLVFFYFSTTNNGQTEWTSCGPSTDDAIECIYLKPTAGGGVQEIPWVRWLSAADECDWAGITCQTINGRLSVTKIELGECKYQIVALRMIEFHISQ